MARPKQFDEAAAITVAMTKFWSTGYEATTIRDLAREMNITGTSLYNSFHDKKTLFRMALKQYFDRTYGSSINSTLPAGPRESIEATLRWSIDTALADPEHKGCLLINSVVEVGLDDAELRDEMVSDLWLIEAYFRSKIEQGQTDGSISLEHKPDDLARFLLGVIVGIRVLARIQPEREHLEALARPVSALLSRSPQVL